MRVVLQRVRRAAVSVDDRTVGAIDAGYLLLCGFRDGDDDDALRWMADRITGLRLFPGHVGGDDTARASAFERTLDDVGGGILVVSQFTLYGDTRKGRRPSFVAAAGPAVARPLYEQFVALLRARTRGPVETGAFGAHMDVALVNDGPVTLVLER